MFVHAAQSMGYFTAVLDPDPLSPAGRVSHQHIQTAYTDPEGLDQLGRCSVAITTEFENVPAQALAELEKMRPVSPGSHAVAIAQDRALEKAHFVQCGVPCAPYAVLETTAQVDQVPLDLLPGILKTARLGYDGKGQVRVANRAELVQAWNDLRQVPCVLEKLLPLQLECSVIVARGADGTCVHLPVQRNLHRDGILAVTEVYEGNVPVTLSQRALAAAKSIADGLDYVGVLCVEFFVLDPASPVGQALGGLVVNEIAPRPHNSGHYSIDACDVSQFELQVRTLVGMPLTQPRQHSPTIMLNLLGDIWPDVRRAQGNGGQKKWGQIPIQDKNHFGDDSLTTKLDSDPVSSDSDPHFNAVLALPGTHLHLYGKAKASKGRKMGHLTITGDRIEQVRATALHAATILGIAPF
jgi:5-(carboxyamino)imidazole ribonucleotide synthase